MLRINDWRRVGNSCCGRSGAVAQQLVEFISKLLRFRQSNNSPRRGRHWTEYCVMEDFVQPPPASGWYRGAGVRAGGVSAQPSLPWEATSRRQIANGWIINEESYNSQPSPGGTLGVGFYASNIRRLIGSRCRQHRCSLLPLRGGRRVGTAKTCNLPCLRTVQEDGLRRVSMEDFAQSIALRVITRIALRLSAQFSGSLLRQPFWSVDRLGILEHLLVQPC